MVNVYDCHSHVQVLQDAVQVVDCVDVLSSLEDGRGDALRHLRPPDGDVLQLIQLRCTPLIICTRQYAAIIVQETAARQFQVNLVFLADFALRTAQKQSAEKCRCKTEICLCTQLMNTYAAKFKR